MAEDTLEEVLFPSLKSSKVTYLRRVLDEVRANEHPYVDLRREGSCLVFFCCLCSAPCSGSSSLFDHLNGKRHARNRVGPKETLMKRNPWPFNDGLCFFYVDEGSILDEVGGNLDQEDDADPEGPCDSTSDGTVQIPGVLGNNSVSNLAVRGVGLITAQLIENDGVFSELRRIWCEWLGDGDISGQGVSLFPEHDFGIVTFPFDYNLGGTVILPRGLEILDSENKKMRKSELQLRKSFRKRLQDEFDDAIRRECSICAQKLLPGRDVAALFNRSTGKLACSSRNSTGEFHLFHVSCLVLWLLHCEVENKPAYGPIVEEERPRKTRKSKSKKTEQSPEEQTIPCPDCEGSSGPTNEKSLSEIKTNLLCAHGQWLKSPIWLDKCSIGLKFIGDEVTRRPELKYPLKSLSFYSVKN